MISALVSRLVILTFGNLYPAYASYKAVRTKDVKLYVKWMMYWIVFAFFTCIETITDIFLSWFPFYYEVKVIIVIWLLSPATKGSSTLYRKFVHPMLTSREHEIDEYINQAKERGYSAVLQLGSKGVNYATNVIMQTALKTVNYGARSNNALATSQSDTNIYDRRLLVAMEAARDDGEDVHDRAWVHRSNSLNALVNMQVEFSEDESRMLDPDYVPDMQEAMDEHYDDVGAARARVPARTRKTRDRKTTSEPKEPKRGKSAPKTGAVRTRRKLRDVTPDMDVDVEAE